MIVGDLTAENVESATLEADTDQYCVLLKSGETLLIDAAIVRACGGCVVKAYNCDMSPEQHDALFAALEAEEKFYGRKT